MQLFFGKELFNSRLCCGQCTNRLHSPVPRFCLVRFVVVRCWCEM